MQRGERDGCQRRIPCHNTQTRKRLGIVAIG